MQNMSALKKLTRTTKKILKHLFSAKVTIYRWQLNLSFLLIFSFGSIFGLYFLATGLLLPKISADSTWSQTDWSGGVGTSTTTQYASSSGVDSTSTAGQLTLSTT